MVKATMLIRSAAELQLNMQAPGTDSVNLQFFQRPRKNVWSFFVQIPAGVAVLGCRYEYEQKNSA